jgi:hypothetical protein
VRQVISSVDVAVTGSVFHILRFQRIIARQSADIRFRSLGYKQGINFKLG